MPAKWHKYSYSAQRQERRSALLVFFFIVLFAAVFWLFHTFLFTMYRVGSPTMEPNLSDGDRVIATPLYKTSDSRGGRNPLLTPVTRGDLAVIGPEHPESSSLFRSAINSVISFVTLQKMRPLSDSRSLVSKPVIRRIVGMPGDTIYLEKSVLRVKTPESSHFLTEFEIINGEYDINMDILPDGWTADLPFSDATAELTLGQNEYFVLCDNRQTASDSRIWGPVPGSRIQAKAFFRYWPLSELGLLH